MKVKTNKLIVLLIVFFLELNITISFADINLFENNANKLSDNKTTPESEINVVPTITVAELNNYIKQERAQKYSEYQLCLQVACPK